MTYQLVRTGKFKKGLKRAKKRGLDIENDVIEVKKACICTELKQIQLETTKGTPSSSNGQEAGKPFRQRAFRHFAYGRVLVGETMNNTLGLFLL